MSVDRWTAHRKAVVIAAVNSGVLTEPELMDRYGISPEEYAEWVRHYDIIGSPEGLKATRRVRPK